MAKRLGAWPDAQGGCEGAKGGLSCGRRPGEAVGGGGEGVPASRTGSPLPKGGAIISLVTRTRSRPCGRPRTAGVGPYEAWVTLAWTPLNALQAAACLRPVAVRTGAALRCTVAVVNRREGPSGVGPRSPPLSRAAVGSESCGVTLRLDFVFVRK